MVLEQSANFAQCQRVQIAFEAHGRERCYKLTVERHDECLGWYTAGSISIPVHQLPLLQQALSLAGSMGAAESEAGAENNIIPFPMLAKAG